MITPTERARIVIRHAHLAGSGLPVTRADILAELAAQAAPTPSLPVAGPEPVTPDPVPITPATPGQADHVVSLAEAADRLGVSVATVRRYLAPSSGRLIRQGDGVSRTSLDALAGDR